jgi:hypothetical protein
MDQRRLLSMQVANSIDDGGHDGHGRGPGKPLSRLLLPHGVQVWPFDILHQDMHLTVPGINEPVIDTRESLVRQLLE